jgi:N6-L-threonylcarbamoyladenine synthase
LKTAVALEVERRGGTASLCEREVADLAAAFEAAATDALVARTRRAVRAEGIARVAVVGGVAANRRLRREMQSLAERESLRVVFPELELCTDNAAMIAAAGARLLASGARDDLGLNAFSRMPLGA